MFKSTVWYGNNYVVLFTIAWRACSSDRCHATPRLVLISLQFQELPDQLAYGLVEWFQRPKCLHCGRIIHVQEEVRLDRSVVW
jgi:hypothetical protein